MRPFAGTPAPTGLARHFKCALSLWEATAMPASGGLSIVAAIVDLHGFGLEIGESELGGARLVLHCPLAGLAK